MVNDQTTASIPAVIEGASADREAWLKKRRYCIGASEVAAVFGVSPWTTSFEMWTRKTQRIERAKSQSWHRAGLHFERAILDGVEEEFGPLLRDVRIPSDDCPIIVSTLDAQVKETTELAKAGDPVEAKTTGLVGPVNGSWGEDNTDELEDYLVMQAMTQIICTGSEICHLYALIAGRGVVPFKIHRDDNLVELIKTECDAWWTKHVIKDIPPEQTEPIKLDVAKRLKRAKGSVVELDATADELVDRRNELKAELKGLKKEVDTLDGQLLGMLGFDASTGLFNESGVLPSGRHVNYLEQTRKSYTVEEAKFRVLRIKKA